MTYDDITLGTWLEMEKEAANYTTDVDKAVARISVLSGYEFDDLYSMPLEKYGKIQNKYRFLTERMPTKIVTEFEGKPFCLDFAKLPFGDFVDLMEILKRDEKAIDLIIAKLWMCDMPLNDAAKVIREKMSVTSAMWLSAFFLDYWENLEIRILRYLNRKVTIQTRRLKYQMIFHRFLHGIYGLTHLRQGMLFGGRGLKK